MGAVSEFPILATGRLLLLGRYRDRALRRERSEIKPRLRFTGQLVSIRCTARELQARPIERWGMEKVGENPALASKLVGSWGQYRPFWVFLLVARLTLAASDLLTSAFEVGFNSKASFNRAFQDFARTSPSAWRVKSQKTQAI